MVESKKKTLRKWIKKITFFWDPVWLRDWGHRHGDRGGWTGFAVRQLEVTVLTARSLYNENVTLRAAALTYHTLLSIVPLMAVAFALFKAFGGLQRLERPMRDLVVQNLAVGREVEVGRWIDQFISNINAGAIAGVGVLILIYSAVGLLTNMERSFNRIWGGARGRPFFTRFAIYWCLISLTPPLMGYSISLTARFESSEFVSGMMAWLPFDMGKFLLSLTSVAAACIAFTLIYLIVPAAKVRPRPAMLGGLVAGLLWSASKYIFISLTAGSIKYSAVYGALGVLPLLMLWMYISWLIALFGNTYAFAIQTVATESLTISNIPINQALRERLTARMAVAVAEDFRAGLPPPDAEALADRLGCMTGVARQLLRVLRKHHIVAETGAVEEPCYLPARDIQELSLEHIAEVLRDKEGKLLTVGNDAVMERISGIFDEAEAASRAVLGKTDLRSLTRLSPRESAEP